MITNTQIQIQIQKHIYTYTYTYIYIQVVASLVDMPEEVCDLNPEKICRYKTALVPSLIPQQECTQVPKESCHLSFSSPEPGKKPLLTKWCLDPEIPDIDENTLETGGISGDENPDSLSSGVFDLRAAEVQESTDVAGLLDVTQELEEEEQATYGNVDLSQSVYSLQGETVGQFYGAPREARGTGRRQNLKKPNSNLNNNNNNNNSNSSLKKRTSSSQSNRSPKQITRSSKQNRFQSYSKHDRSDRKRLLSSGSATGRKQQNQSHTSSRKAFKQGKSRVITQLKQNSRSFDKNPHSH